MICNIAAPLVTSWLDYMQTLSYKASLQRTQNTLADVVAVIVLPVLIWLL